MDSPPPPGRPLFSSTESPWAGEAPWKFHWFLLWRLLGGLLIVVIVLTATFAVIEVLPADPTAFFLPRFCRTPAGCGAARQQVITQWGLDQPIPVQYQRFLTNILTGNFGESTAVRPGMPVWSLIAPVLPRTLAVVGVILLLTAVVTLALGLLLARRKGSVADAWVSFALAVPFAATIPTMALLGIYVFFIRLQWIAVPGSSLSFEPATLGYIALLMAVLLGSVTGLFAWLVRDYPMSPPPPRPPPPGDWRSQESRGRTWVRKAIAKFLSPVPALAAWTVSAVLVTETVWNFGGLGVLLWDGFLTADTVLVLAIVMLVGLGVVLPLILVADVLHELLAGSWVRTDGRSVEAFQVDARHLGRALKALLDNATGFAGVTLILILVGTSIAAPYVAGPYPTALTLGPPNQPPSAQHFLGTDAAGSDILTLILYGGIPAIPVALLAFTLALMAGLAVVAATGLLGPRVEVFVNIPLDAALVFSFALVWMAPFLFPGAWIALWFFLPWPVTARLLQREVRGLVPNGRGPRSPGEPSAMARTVNLIWGTGPLILGNALLAVALALSMWATLGAIGFGGLGATPVRGWGGLLFDAYIHLAVLRGAWWYVLPPALCIFGAVLAPLLLSLGVKQSLWGGRGSPRRPPPAPVALPVPEPAPPAP